jgi:uncharacterized protein (DUF305 family)
MQNKPLLYGLIGFFIGGFIVSVAATTFDKPEPTHTNEMSMSEMTASLQKQTGDDYDKAFIDYMIEHHKSAVDMAKLSAQNAKHEEIKQLSNDIVAAQQKEISQMKQWQHEWGYTTTQH